MSQASEGTERCLRRRRSCSPHHALASTPHTLDTLDTLDSLDTLDTLDTLDSLDSLDTLDTLDTHARQHHTHISHITRQHYAHTSHTHVLTQRNGMDGSGIRHAMRQHDTYPTRDAAT
eukprot:1908864-Rhodomonas_salina.3